MDIKKREQIFFMFMSLLLTLFQIIVYLKLCTWPTARDFNLLLLLIALIWPFMLSRIKDKRLYVALFCLYLIYIAIVADGFVEALLNPNVNCDGTIFVGMKEFL